MPLGHRAQWRPGKKLTLAWHFSRANEWIRPQYQCGWCKREGKHRGRNCKQFPDEWKTGRPPDVWVRTITGPAKGKDQPGAQVRVASSTECPVSAITPESLWLIEMVHGSRVAHEMTGAAMFGADASRWPAIYFDAVRTIHRAKTRELEAMTNGR